MVCFACVLSKNTLCKYTTYIDSCDAFFEYQKLRSVLLLCFCTSIFASVPITSNETVYFIYCTPKEIEQCREKLLTPNRFVPIQPRNFFLKKDVQYTQAAYHLRYHWAAAGRSVHVFLFSSCQNILMSGDGKQVNSKMETHNTPRLFYL